MTGLGSSFERARNPVGRSVAGQRVQEQAKGPLSIGLELGLGDAQEVR